MASAPDRRLAAILFTDVVGYTALMAEDEERGLRVRERHRELVLPVVERHRGEPIEMRGDECLAVFPSALDAVRCALVLQDEIQEEPDLDLHLGIHVGDVVRVGNEVSGDGVNVARRLCALSESGGLCVSGEVWQGVRNQPDIEARQFGARELKNVGRPVEVVALGRPGRVRPVSLPRVATRRRYVAAVAAVALLLIAAAWWAFGRDTLSSQPIRSIAVLPLDNLTGDPEQEYFVDGMTEALIAGLARIGSLRVTSRTSVMVYKGTTLSLPEIADDLDVDALIEGSVSRDGDRVRVTAQLIDARRDQHLWAEQYDRDLRDVPGLQREIASGVAQQVRVRMTPEEQARLEPTPIPVPEAYEAYLKGWYFAQKHTAPAALRARAHFEDSMRLDPEFPLGYAGLADTLSCSPLHTWVIAAEGADATPVAVMDLANDLATRAIELDPNLPEAKTALGLVRIFREWDWDGGLASIDDALEINPSYEFGLRARALTLAYVGRLDEAKGSIDTALEVDPLSAQVNSIAGDIHGWRGEFETATALWREVTALDAGNPLGRQRLGMLRCRTDEFEQGLELLNEAREVSGHDPLIVGDLGYCYAIHGRSDEARALLAELEQRSASEWVSPVSLARIHIGLGDREAALGELERALGLRAYRLVELGVDDRWDPIRDDPRFQEIERRIGISS